MALTLNDRVITVLGPIKMEVIDVTSDGTDTDSTLTLADSTTENFTSRLAHPRWIGIAPGSDCGATVDTSVALNNTEGNVNFRLITVHGAPEANERYTVTVFGT